MGSPQGGIYILVALSGIALAVSAVQRLPGQVRRGRRDSVLLPFSLSSAVYILDLDYDPNNFRAVALHKAS